MLLLIFLTEGVIIFIEIFKSENIFTQFLEIQLFLFYSIAVFRAVRNFGLMNLFTLFLLTFGLFNFMKFFYAVLSDDNYKSVFVVVPVELTEQIAQKALWIYSITLTVAYFAYSFFANNNKNNEKYIQSNYGKNWFYNHSSRLCRLGSATMLLTLPFVLYRCYIEVSFFSSLSFTDLYVSGSSSLPIPSYVRLLSVFFQVGFMMVLGSRPSKRQFLFYSLFYVLTTLPNLLIGLRIQFALSIVFIIWYYAKVYEVRFKPSRLILPVLGMVFILQLVAAKRDGGAFESILMMIPLFLTYQSTSMYVLCLYIEYKNKLVTNYPFILDPAIGWLTGVDGQSLEVLEKRSSLGHQMIYAISPDAYLSGTSLGTTFVAELYEFGILGVIAGASVLSWMIAKFEFNVKLNRYYLLLSMFFCSYILISPRSSFLPNFYFLLRYALVFGMIMLIGSLFKKKLKILDK